MIILKPFWFFLTDKFVSSLLPNHSDVSISKKDVSNRFRLSEEEITYVVLLMYHNDYGGGSLSCFATLKSLLHSLKLMRLTPCIYSSLWPWLFLSSAILYALVSLPQGMLIAGGSPFLVQVSSWKTFQMVSIRHSFK